MTPNIRLYNGLTYDAHKNALATAQAMHIAALDRHSEEDKNRWAAEEARITAILDNWNVLSTPEA